MINKVPFEYSDLKLLKRSPSSSPTTTSTSSSSTVMSQTKEEMEHLQSAKPLPQRNTNSNRSSPDELNGVQSSQCSSSLSSADRDLIAEENFETFGDNEDVEYDSSELVDFEDTVDFGPNNSISSPPSSLVRNDGGDLRNINNNNNNKNLVRRNSWMRTSLRRSSSSAVNPPDTISPKRWGSFRYPSKRVGSHAIASQLYHNGTSSFNSSGRSSNCDEGEMQSDISLEEDVTDLNQKVQMLTAKVDVLTESQAITDDKYSKVRNDNASLTSRINELEEEVRELQVQSHEQIEQEQKRSKEMIARLEREKQLEIENYAIRLQNLEKDNGALQVEINNLKHQLETSKNEKRNTEDSLQETQLCLSSLRDENKMVSDENQKLKEIRENERQGNQHIIEELSKEIELLRQQSSAHLRTSALQTVHSIEEDEVMTSSARLNDLENELRRTREEVRKLTVKNDELEGQLLQRGVEQGQLLISNVPSEGDTSLRNELENLSDSQDLEGTKAELSEIRVALKDQQEVNFQLRHYIDGILMNIMEKYPELLEVRK